MIREHCTGIVEYLKLSNRMHQDPYSGLETMPIVCIGIKNEQSELKEFELPIKMPYNPFEIPSNPFSIIPFEKEIKGQKVTYSSKYSWNVSRWKLYVHSGKFKSVDYTLEELSGDD